MAQRWELVTAELDPRARAGDAAAIRKKLAERGTEKKTETAVWVDHGIQPLRAEAVTSELSTRVYLPDSVLTRLRNREKRIQLWHNHLEADGEPGNAVPSAEDIGVAVLPGVLALTTVDDNQRWTRIRRGANADYHPMVATIWVQNALRIARRALRANNDPPVDEEDKQRREERAAEAAAGAAVAVGLIKAEGLSGRGLEEGRIAARLANSQRNGTLDAIKSGIDVSGKEPDGLRNVETSHDGTRRGRWKKSRPEVGRR